MNAGTDYRRAKRHAIANATATARPRWLHLYNGVWWISHTPIEGAERVDPAPAPELDQGEQADRDDRPERRRLTTYERHQAAADAGVDTWEDYRGER
jgi:hypothetical protein